MIRTASPARASAVRAALARDRLGVPAVVFFVMSGIAPLTVAAGVVTTAYAVTGLTGIPAAFLAVALVIGCFSVGCVGAGHGAGTAADRHQGQGARRPDYRRTPGNPGADRLRAAASGRWPRELRYVGAQQTGRLRGRRGAGHRGAGVRRLRGCGR